MKEDTHKCPHSIWFHLCEMSRIVKFIEWLPGPGRIGGEKDYKGFIQSSENYANGLTTLCVYEKTGELYTSNR